MKIKFLVLLLLVVSSSYAQSVVTFKSEYNRSGLYSEEDILFNSWKQQDNSIKFYNNEIVIYNSKDTITVITEPDNMSDRDDVGVWKGKVNGKSVLVIFIIEVDIKTAYLTLVYKENNNLIQYKFSQQSKL